MKVETESIHSQSGGEEEINEHQNATGPEIGEEEQALINNLVASGAATLVKNEAPGETSVERSAGPAPTVKTEGSEEEETDSIADTEIAISTANNPIKIEVAETLAHSRQNENVGGDDPNASRPQVAAILKVEVQEPSSTSSSSRQRRTNNINSENNVQQQNEEREAAIIRPARDPLVPIPLNISWSQRALGSANNVTQTLLNRQLGFPFYTRSEENISNYFNEMKIGRQLIEGRASNDEGKKSTPRPVKLKHNRTKNKSVSDKPGWMQLQTGNPKTTEVTIVDTNIWTRCKPGQRGGTVYQEEFFSLEPSTSFARVKSLKSTGKLKKAAILEVRTLGTKPKTSTYLLTLSEPNYLRAFDILNKQRPLDELQLSMEIVPNIKGYTELEVCEKEAKLFVMATEPGSKKNVKVILILDYPPSWTKVGIIYVDIPLKLSICDGLCFILQDKHNLRLSTWPFLKEKVKAITTSTGRTPEPQLKVMFEGRIEEMPKIFNTIVLDSEYYGLIEGEIPLFYGRTKAGMAFFPPINADDENVPPPVYQFSLGIEDKEDPIEVFPLPGYKPRALVVTHMSNNYELASFNTTPENATSNSTAEKNLEARITKPFNYWDEARAQRRATSSTASSSARVSRPRRACSVITNSLLSSEKKAILGLSYCPLLQLIGVLTADEEEFIVVLYDSFSLSVFKALPPLFIWPATRDGNTHKNRELIEKVDFAFEPQFIFISFEYNGQQREFFTFPLMLESILD